MDGNTLTGLERLDLSGNCFQFVFDQIVEPGVECVGWSVCALNSLCSKTRALSRFARKTFEFEERMMLSSGYPGFDVHVSDHRRLISRLEGGPGIRGCGDCLSWIREVALDWGQDHANNYDYQLKLWLG
jgi:hypothetical protein